MLDTAILVAATAMAAVGVGALIMDQVRAIRAEGLRPISGDLWRTLLWAIALFALFVAAWASRR